MHQPTRRKVLNYSLVFGAGLATPIQEAAEDDKEPQDRDRKNVMAAGMTAEEADCWKLAAQTAGAFFKLPELHPMDNHEIAQAIHIIQNKLLGRPTYRRYLELSKQGATERDAGGN